LELFFLPKEYINIKKIRITSSLFTNIYYHVEVDIKASGLALIIASFSFVNGTLRKDEIN
jgi:hypothetical protein